VAVDLDGVGVAVATKDLRSPGGRSDEPQQQTDRGRLAGAVRTQVADDVAARNLEVQRYERLRVTEGLREVVRPDGVVTVTHDDILPI